MRVCLMDFKLGTWGTNDRWDEDPTITISDYRISFNVQFVKQYNLQTAQYVYINGPIRKDANHIQIVFLLSEKADVVPGVKPFKLNKHPKVERYQTTPKTWFDKNNLRVDQVAGAYTPIEKKDPRLGTLFVIEIEVKK